MKNVSARMESDHRLLLNSTKLSLLYLLFPSMVLLWVKLLNKRTSIFISRASQLKFVAKKELQFLKIKTIKFSMKLNSIYSMPYLLNLPLNTLLIVVWAMLLVMLMLTKEPCFIENIKTYGLLVIALTCLHQRLLLQL